MNLRINPNKRINEMNKNEFDYIEEANKLKKKRNLYI